ncbi:MAG: hypothetical protein IJ867_06530 [Clostridia bacterium]|nr:hypothetical protein [Clostridia bacterium]
MEEEKKSKNGLLIFIIILVIAVVVGVAVALLTKGDVKNLASSLTGAEATKITAKLELEGEREIVMPYQEEFTEPRIYSDR